MYAKITNSTEINNHVIIPNFQYRSNSSYNTTPTSINSSNKFNLLDSNVITDYENQTIYIYIL